MAQRTIPLSQPTATRGARRGMHLLEAITAVAVVAALLAVGARAMGRLPSERTAATSNQPTRLIQMDGVWVDAATNPKRERFFRVLNPRTGAETGETLPFHLPEDAYPRAFSADGRTLAYTANPSSLAASIVSVVDIVTGAVRRTLTYEQPTSVMRLNADGSRLVLYRLSAGMRPPFTLLTVDVASGATISTVTLSSTSEEWPILTPDLRTAYVLDTHNTGSWPGVTSGEVTLDVIDTAMGTRHIVPLSFVRAGVFPEDRTVQGQPVIRSFSPALVPSPDSRRLYIVHADEDAITVVNLKEARVERTESIHPIASAARALFGWLAPEQVAAKEASESMSKQATVSPDGRTLAITGMTGRPRDDGSYDVTDQGVQLVDLRAFTTTGHALQQQYQGYTRPLTVQWSADGQTLYIGTISNDTADAYQLRIMDARTHTVTASQTYMADSDFRRYLPSTWFALPQ